MDLDPIYSSEEQANEELMTELRASHIQEVRTALRLLTNRLGSSNASLDLRLLHLIATKVRGASEMLSTLGAHIDPDEESYGMNQGALNVGGGGLVFPPPLRRPPALAGGPGNMLDQFQPIIDQMLAAPVFQRGRVSPDEQIRELAHAIGAVEKVGGDVGPMRARLDALVTASGPAPRVPQVIDAHDAHDAYDVHEDDDDDNVPF